MDVTAETFERDVIERSRDLPVGRRLLGGLVWALPHATGDFLGRVIETESRPAQAA